jgi:hypothetical protein
MCDSDDLAIAQELQHVITVPYKILVQMPYHKKSEETIAEFDRAWQEFKQAEKTDWGDRTTPSRRRVTTFQL